ncbi:transcription termination factor Rho [Candidatus Daviesbacteria bacterium RIFOXYD1_FULL_41_10]|uniref:Transcription termination factor Rho n=2 Tax=Patescibacteria group TaxID=1783273 RepID=A0A1F5N0A5_9BACT|nr:MAG: Transcription termination factor Rho [Candidatus Azambacteria bacterium GW2011_GWA1_44_9]OGE71044.1 MAG: transcription termination factor Rho [Candidatus Daviesbacteria bacterium RIFOXYD1_FULL_41_10]
MPNTRSFKPKTIPADEFVGKPIQNNPESQNIRESENPEFRNNYRNNGYSERDRDVPTEEVSGILDIMPEGHGFLRPKYTPSDRDVYISASQIRRFNLRPGDLVDGAARPPKENERYFGLLQVNKINGEDAEKFVAGSEPGSGRTKRVRFEDLTAIYPNKHLKLETGKTPVSQRVIDLVSPIGFGQRGLIVSPPKAGKTTILKDIAAGITANFPDVVLMAVLVGERPEEVTDISRSIKGDVIASNFDEPAENQTTAAEIALERAKRLVEQGKDVVILLDSVTRLGRAYNLSIPPSGRTLSGGFDPAALYPPKKFFGAARNCEEGGSLTIIGTALVETGSRMDDLVYEEFKGTGNMELHLDRGLSERRIFPAIDIESSGTRQEQLLFPEDIYRKIVVMRRMLSLLNDSERTEVFLERLSKAASNKEFLETLKDVK